MSDTVILENYVDHQCVRHVHLMSNIEMDQGSLMRYAPPGVGWVCSREAGVWHCRVSYQYHGMLDVDCMGNQKRFRRLVVWHLEGCTSVTQALREAQTEYCRCFGGQPGFAFMKKLPKSVVNGVEVLGMSLTEAEWMLERCVAVGGRQF